MKDAPLFLWRPLSDSELGDMAHRWRLAGKYRDMETMDILYSAWTHRVAAAPGHWDRLQDKLDKTSRRIAV